MKEYVDIFIVPVRKKKLAAYRKTSMGFGRLMLEYGAKRYGEFVGDDLKPKNMPDMGNNAFPSSVFVEIRIVSLP
ncbi:MAG: DUF1428 family protein [Candidatus Woesearchaeota archaeon]